MANALLDGNVTDQNGAVVPGALVYIYDHAPDGGLVELFDSMGQATANPVTSGEDGYWSAYAEADQFYTFKYFWGGRERRIDANQLLGTASINLDPNVRTDLSSTAPDKGAALVGFKQSGTGAVDRTMEAKAREVVSVTDFGATGDGTTDDTAAVQAALDALGSDGELRFPPGSYKLTDAITFDSLSNIRLLGTGATVKAATRFTSYFHLSGCSNVHIEGFTFDQGQPSLATYTSGDYPTLYNCAIYLTDATDSVTVTRCRFINLYTASIYGVNLANVDVTHCVFTSPLQSQDQFLSFVHLITTGGVLNVSECRFIGAATTRNDRSPCAVGLSGVAGSATIRDNYAEHCGRNNAGSHRLGVFDLYADAKNVTVKDNTAVNCREQFMRLSTSVDCQVCGNKIAVAAEADATYSTMTIESGSYTGVANPIVKRIRIKDNTVIDAANRQAYAFGVLTYDWGAAPVDVELSGNNIQGAEAAFYVQGPFQGLRILKNTVSDVLIFLNMTMKDSGGTDLTLTTDLGTQANSVTEGLRIEDNDITIRAGSVNIPVGIATNRSTPYTGRVGEFTFRRNRMSCDTPGTSFALNVIFNASVAQGRIYADDNTIEGYATPFLIRSAAKARVTGNHYPNGTALFSTDGSVGDIEATANRITDAARKGAATLVAGTVTVNTAEIMAGDVVRVSRVVRGGTIGVDVICDAANHVAGTSLRIDAIDASGSIVTTDTSTVAWEIIGR